MRKFNLQRILIFSAGLILLAFLFSGLRYFSINQGDTSRPVEWKNLFFAQAIIYSWAILSPLIVFFAKRFRFEQQNWWRLLPAHLFAALVFLLLYRAIFASFFKVVDPTRVAENGGFLAFTLILFIRNWIVDFPTYCFLLSSIYVVDFYRRFQAEKLKSSELKAALATSQLDALKMQIHPHFLFNTLNSISALMHEDVKAADKMVARLGDFLRMTLENSGDREVSLKQEMDFVGRYLEIESVRFQDRLSVKMNIDPETLAARVPNLILQPIVENAIKHGISRQTDVGSLIISSERRGDRLQIRVEDSGPGLQSSNGNAKGSKIGGIGLANTRARLAYLYEENYQFEIKNAVPHGVIVMLEIPFETIKGLQQETDRVEIK
ncbi:MAG TPA: histidine kinase [Pyrinomonadaceae bacterium]|nr:histidine kinase [Pyrinomonadaceae bacterium]